MTAPRRGWLWLASVLGTVCLDSTAVLLSFRTDNAAVPAMTVASFVATGAVIAALLAGRGNERLRTGLVIALAAYSAIKIMTFLRFLNSVD